MTCNESSNLETDTLSQVGDCSPSSPETNSDDSINDEDSVAWMNKMLFGGKNSSEKYQNNAEKDDGLKNPEGTPEQATVALSGAMEQDSVDSELPRYSTESVGPFGEKKTPEKKVNSRFAFKVRALRSKLDDGDKERENLHPADQSITNESQSKNSRIQPKLSVLGTKISPKLTENKLLLNSNIHFVKPTNGSTQPLTLKLVNSKKLQELKKKLASPGGCFDLTKDSTDENSN